MTNKILIIVLIVIVIFFLLTFAFLLFSAEKIPSSTLTDAADFILQEKLPPRIRIFFKNIGSLIVIPVRVNDSRELNMILDTGMSAGVTVLFHAELGDELGLEYTQEVVVAGAGEGETKKAHMTGGVKVEISDLVLYNQTVVVIDEKRETSRWTFDGIIGKSVFDSYVVEIDYLRSILFIHEPINFSADHPEQAIPITLDRGLPVIEAIIDTEEEKGIPVKLIVDLGARHTLMFNVIPQKKIVSPKKTLTSILGRGVQGELSGKTGRLPKLQIGGFVFHQVITNFAPEGSNTGIQPSGFVFDGNLGFGLLKRFKVVLDYPHQRMFLIPNETSDKPFEFNMLGISYEQRMDGSLYVRDVITGSPASEKGIKKGDVIIAINGKNLQKYDYMDIYDLFRKENKKIKITLQRESKQIKVSLTQKRLI
jgi:hypothetical protein